LKFWFGLKLCDNKTLYWCSKWLCYNANFLKLCSEYKMEVGSNYCMNNVYLRFYQVVMDNTVQCFFSFFSFFYLCMLLFRLPSW